MKDKKKINFYQEMMVDKGFNWFKEPIEIKNHPRLSFILTAIKRRIIGVCIILWFFYIIVYWDSGYL